MNPTLIPSFDEAAARAAAEACGAQLVDDPHGPQARFASLPAASAPSGSGDAAIAAGPAGIGAPAGAEAPAGATAASAVAAGALALLPDWGILSISGAEAVKFLHGQTTNDIEGQPADEVRLNGYCTPKGRLLAGGPLWRDAEDLYFAVSRPLAEPLRKRLSMFVLRAKAKVEDVSNRFAVLGLCGAAAPDALRAIGIEPPEAGRLARGVPGAAPAGDTADSTSTRGTEGAAASVPLAIGLSQVEGIGCRWWLVLPVDLLQATWARLAERLTPIDSDTWRASEILAGEPRIVPATSEAFIPQTLNWELIGGVNFRKGCYPGQEVVARMHYRGKPKRRSFAAQLAEGPALAPGADLLAPDSEEPAGVVVSWAPAPGGGQVLLYEAPIALAMEAGLRTADGRVLDPLPSPHAFEA